VTDDGVEHVFAFLVEPEEARPEDTETIPTFEPYVTGADRPA
jgi:hypothetical protein